MKGYTNPNFNIYILDFHSVYPGTLGYHSFINFTFYVYIATVQVKQFLQVKQIRSS